MKILVLNSGSSTQKSALFDLEPGTCTAAVPPLWEGRLEWDANREILTIRNCLGRELRQESQVSSDKREESLEKMLRCLCAGPTAVAGALSEIAVVGHRIVHGGAKLTQPVVITPEVKQAISEVSTIAPLHNHAGLQGIELIEKLLPGTRQIAVFDTGFHRTLPPEARIYPGPYAWYEHGIQRYGFHGINHEYCAHRAAELLRKEIGVLKIVTCHLGNGCSLAAIDGGRSVDTTMGFTPLEGLMMGTRSGSVDPGILTHLLRSGLQPADLDRVLNQQSGLLGISGASGDMRDILRAMGKGNQRATLAFDIFIHRLRHGIAAMAASLGRVDALVFTAGIGENSPEVRREACAQLGFLGIRLDETRNLTGRADFELSAAGSQVRILVIHAQEDWAIARKAVSLI